MSDRYNGWAIASRLYFTAVGYLMGTTGMIMIVNWGGNSPWQYFFAGVVTVGFVGVFVFASIQDRWAKRVAERERR